MGIERIAITGEVSLSRMAYGLWRLADDKDCTPAHIRAKLESCLDQGITTLDVADIYGGYRAESLLGAAFAANPGLRARVEIVTKCGIIAPVGRYAQARVKHYDSSAAHIRASVDHSLRDLQTDHIDLLLLHRPDPLIDPEDTARGLEDVVASGKVRTVGVSNYRAHDIALLQSAMTQPLCVNQIELSLAAHKALTNGDLAYLQRTGRVAMGWSPLAGGALFASSRVSLIEALREMAAAKGVDLAALAVAWLLRHPAQIIPVMGTNNLSRIAKLSDAFAVPMSREDWFILYAAARGTEVA